MAAVDDHCMRATTMLVQTHDARHSFSHAVRPAPSSALAHIPGDDGWPLLGHTLPVLSDPKGFVERRAERYGPVYRSHAFGQSNLSLLGPAAPEVVLLGIQKLFSISTSVARTAAHSRSPSNPARCSLISASSMPASPRAWRNGRAGASSNSTRPSSS